MNDDFRVIEKKGMSLWRVQIRQRFLFFSWWRTDSQSSLVGGCWPRDYCSLASAIDRIDQLKSWRKSDLTPWTEAVLEGEK